jgi:hypothetical protein
VLPRVADAGNALRVVELRLPLVGESQAAAVLAPLEAALPDGVRLAYLA